MDAEKLKDSVRGIQMKEEMREAVIANVKRRTVQTDVGSSKRKAFAGHKRCRTGWRKNLAAAALILVAAGAAAFPVRAFVNSLVKERMELMPQTEKDVYVENIKKQKAEADGFTRGYSEQEKQRYEEMARQYQAGIFPDKEVVQVESEKEAEAYEFCYLKPTSVFCLPERELTDEELLEIIDFMVKREYAYREDYEKENAEEIAKEEKQQETEIEANVAEGGITEQQAIETAERKLTEIFNITGEGFERNSYYTEREEEKEAYYCVNWTDFIRHQYYYFDIDAGDGHMVNASYSGSEVHDTEPVTIEEACSRIPQLYQMAVEFEEKMIGGTYDSVYVYYLQYQDGTAGNGVRFYFTGEDQNAFSAAYTWDGILYEAGEKSISGREDGKEQELWNGEGYRKANEVFQKVEE